MRRTYPVTTNTGLRGYVAGLARNVAHEWSMVVACLPTVLLLMLAAMFGWHDDRCRFFAKYDVDLNVHSNPERRIGGQPEVNSERFSRRIALRRDL